MRIGFDENNWWWGGRISTTQIYNRSLSEEEIKRNFEVTKDRFLSNPDLTENSYVQSGYVINYFT